MDWVTPELAVGSIDDALAPWRLHADGISAVLALNDFPTFLEGSGFHWRRVLLMDGEGNPPERVLEAVAALEELLADGHSVLVQCAEGVSRAPFVVACLLARRRGWELDEAIAFVVSRRPIANPHPALCRLWSRMQETSRIQEQPGARL